jgi:hypothetical protein
MDQISISVIHGDALLASADTLILKYAQAPHGLDKVIIRRFAAFGNPVEHLPDVWHYRLIDSRKITNTSHVLFIGVPPLEEFGYQEIREFGRQALMHLAHSVPHASSFALTVHGPGYGLDETEAFESQIAGIVDSITAGAYPKGLEKIIFVEQSERLAQRLQAILKYLFPSGYIPKRRAKGLALAKESSLETLRLAGNDSESKKSVFVAMPFSSYFDDIFYYGIQGAVNAAGYLCERADLQSFTGDVMERVKTRISSANFVIADLTTANPNVYLEVGFAWGQNKKAVLLIKDTTELKFNTRGQRCLPYKSIKDLETKLKAELDNLNI